MIYYISAKRRKMNTQKPSPTPSSVVGLVSGSLEYNNGNTHFMAKSTCSRCFGSFTRRAWSPRLFKDFIAVPELQQIRSEATEVCVLK